MKLNFDYLIILILIGVFYYLFSIKKDFKKLQEPKEVNPLDFQNKILETINIFKQEFLSYFQNFYQTTLERQEKISFSASKLEEIARNIESSTVEVKTLKEILAGPKTRGYLGEIMLKEIIKILPVSFYEEQFQIGSERVDYVLKLNEVLIPIDAKFPIQNFKKIFDLDNKDKQSLKKELIKNLKNEIESVSKKYIIPLKGTVEFALVYLANEVIYYELLTDKDFEEVWEFAREKSVFLTSPKYFELLCSSLLLVIRKQELAKNVYQILNGLHQLEKDFLELESKFETLFTQLNNSFKNFYEVSRILQRISGNYKSLLKIKANLKDNL